MDRSENKIESKIIDNSGISALHKYDFDPQLKDALKVLFEKSSVLSGNLKIEFKNLSVHQFSNLVENSIISSKNRLLEMNNLLEPNIEDAHKFFESYFIDSEVVIENIPNLFARNLLILNDSFHIYLIEFSKIINEIPDKLYYGGHKNELDTVISEEYNNTITEPVSQIPINKNLKEVDLKRIILINAPQIFSKCINHFVENIDSYCYQLISSMNKTMQLPFNLIPPQDFDINIFLKSIKQKNIQLSDIEINSDINFTDLEEKFDNHLIKLQQNFDFDIENEICKLFNDPIVEENKSQIETNLDLAIISKEFLSTLTSKSKLISASFFNEIKFENILSKTKINIFNIIRFLYFDIEKLIKENLIVKNERFAYEIESSIECYKQGKRPENENLFLSYNKLETSVFVNLENIIDSSIHKLKLQINTVPDRFELIKEIDYNHLNFDIIENSLNQKILANRIVDGIVTNEIISLIESLNSTLANKLTEIDNEIINQNRLIKYSIFNLDNSENNKFIENEDFNVLEFLNQKLSETEQNKIKINNFSNSVSDELLKAFYITEKKLQLNKLINEADSLVQYIPKKSVYKGISKIKKTSKSIGKFIDKLIDKFWSHQSDAQILADDLWCKQKFSSPVYNFINSIELLAQNKKVKAEIPFFYRNLFLSKNYFNNDFWVGRKTELNRAQMAYNRFLSGFGGSLMITGDRFSGKSFLARYFCSEILKVKKTIFIQAPESGLVDSKLLLKTLQEQTGLKGDFAKIFTLLEPETIVIFEDLELWWEKSEIGNKVIHQIFDILENYNQRLFFIVSIGSHPFQIIEKIIKFRSLFLDILECKPFNSRLLQSIVMFRHQTSGLKFDFVHGLSISRKKTEETFKPKNFSNLFSKYFTYSDGNIGICLLAWMSNIVGINNNRLIMRLPQSPIIHELDNLEKEHILFIYQFIIHKKLDIEKLSRVLLIPIESIQKQVDFFKRSGIIVKQGSVLEINPYINHILEAFLKKQDLL